MLNFSSKTHYSAQFGHGLADYSSITLLHHHYIIVGVNEDTVELEDEGVWLLVGRGQKVRK